MIAGAYVVALEPRGDARGYLARTYCQKEFAGIGIDRTFVQCNQTLTATKHTIRGLHYQLPPASEIKLVRCLSGEVWDVMVDLRKDSATFLEHFSIVLSGKNQLAVLIPEGVAHGFQTLSDNCELFYMHSAFYAPEYERGVRFDDPMIQISWPHPVSVISERDQRFPLLSSDFSGIIL